MKTLIFGAVLIGLTCLQALGAKVGIYSIGDLQNNKTLSRVLLQTGDETLFGAEFIISHNPALEVESVECPDSAFVSNTNVPGQIQIALANASGITGDQIVVQIEFKKVIDSPDISLPSISLNEGNIVSIGSPDNAVFDKDDDGLLDADELDYFNTDPDLKDTDGDELIDGEEVNLTSTNPNAADSDGDGVVDSEDDQDGDGLSNIAEIKTYNTDPLLIDSDGDNFSDSEELKYELDPNVATSASDVVSRFTTFEESYQTLLAERDARPTQEAYNVVVADRDSKIESINQLQATVEVNNSTIAELEKRPTAEQLSTAIAERDARPTQETYDTVVAERDSKIESINQLQATVEANNSTIAELEKRPTVEQLSTAIAERDARPTQEAYDAVVAERDARPTTDQLQDARNGSVVINSSNGEVIVSFNIEESEDLKIWQATGEKITKTIQLKDGKKFYRFALDK